MEIMCLADNEELAYNVLLRVHQRRSKTYKYVIDPIFVPCYTNEYSHMMSAIRQIFLSLSTNYGAMEISILYVKRNKGMRT